MNSRRIVRLVLIAAVGFAGFGVGACQSAKGPRTIQSHRDAGDRAYLAGDFETAESEYRAVIMRVPSEKQYRKAYGMALLANGNAALARENLEIAHTFRPRDAEVIEALGTAMWKSGDQEGMVRFMKGIADERGTVADWMRAARVMEAAGDHDEARRAYLIAARVDGGMSIEPQLALAQFYKATGDDVNAMDRLRMAYYLKPANARVLSLALEWDAQTGLTFGKQPREQISAEADAGG